MWCGEKCSLSCSLNLSVKRCEISHHLQTLKTTECEIESFQCSPASPLALN